MGRGLSPVQHAIMKQARMCGYVTPAQAVEESWANPMSVRRDCSFRTQSAWVASTASRTLRRLCQRGLLWYERAGFVGQSNVYRVVGWHGAVPWIDSTQHHIQDLRWSTRLPSVDTLRAMAAMETEKAIGQAAS